MQDYRAYPEEMDPKGIPHYLVFQVREETSACQVPLEYPEERAQKEVLDHLE